ncbi:GDSL lipase/esterase [Dillenia turbinata]|uniref:GDSL lipase/esterase n=1 Tax=Dillenia turbinata TaxID=194707 RepID=A0AAN8W711_9MAGN
MAKGCRVVCSNLIIILWVCISVLPYHGHALCPFEAIYQFGDSIADTGNIAALNHKGQCSLPPYGRTYFGHPVGRCSDGLLIIDYFAQALRLPFLPPYENQSTPTNQGVDFAVAGSTALDASFFTERNVNWTNMQFNTPLIKQLEWFQLHLKNSLCKTLAPAECGGRLSKSLFIVGEIGFNDFNYPLMSKKSIQELETYVPHVVQAVTVGVKISLSTSTHFFDYFNEVIRLGAIKIVVPGMFPFGCFPFYLARATASVPKEAFDNFGCWTDYNELPSLYNKKLEEALSLLRQESPKADILYADYYNAFLSLLQGAPSLGFDEKSLLKPCCVGNGKPPYFNKCSPDGTVCPNSGQHISWDGIHPTQEAAKHMAEYLIKNTLSKIACV